MKIDLRLEEGEKFQAQFADTEQVKMGNFTIRGYSRKQDGSAFTSTV